MITVVRAAKSTDLTTLARIIQDLPDLAPADHDLVENLIAECSDYVRTYCNRSFERQRVKETLPGYGTADLLVSLTPVVQVFAIDFKGEPITDFVVSNPNQGVLYRQRGWNWTAGLVGWLTVRPMPGTESPDFEPDYIGGFLLPGDDYEAETISATALTKTFADSASKFPILGAGDRIKVSGFANAGNNGTFTVVSATESAIVVSESVVDEAASNLVRLVVRNLPREIERAVIDSVKAHFNRRQSPMGGVITSQSIGEVSVSFANQIQESSGLPLVSELMLKPWKRVAQG